MVALLITATLVARQRHISGVISVVISGNVVGGCWLVINSPTGRSGSRGRQPGPGQQAASSRLTKGSMQAGKGQQFSDVVCLQNGRRGFIYKSSSELSPSSTPPPSCRSASSPPAPMSLLLRCRTQARVAIKNTEWLPYLASEKFCGCHHSDSFLFVSLDARANTFAVDRGEERLVFRV